MLWWQGRLRAIGHVGLCLACRQRHDAGLRSAAGDDPERIGPIQATGMDQTLFNRVGEYRTQQWATTFDSPLKPEGPLDGATAWLKGTSRPHAGPQV